MRYAYEWEGEELRDSEPHRVDWTDPVRVGVIAENTTGRRAEVTFDHFTLTQAKNEATP